jgi:mannose-6-phosphate isomerase-like protein (cupin superfamily)
MRAALFGFTLATIAIVPQAFAQAPAADTPPKLLATAAEIQAMMAANKSGNIVKIGPYRANLELRAAGVVGAAAIHPHGNEFFYIIDGTVDINTGGTLLDQKSDSNNSSIIVGSKIDGGTTVRLSKGDFYIVPANTPHQLTPVGGKVAEISLLLPAAAPPP